ncbi:MAG: hypothetical protein R3192_13410 [Woeseiaceae bacterium]|nr:hypothetical protein [Woeseiaceae bacterium]
MTGNRVLTLVAIGWLFCSAAVSGAPLFESQQAIDVVIEAPIERLSRQRKNEPELPGKVIYVDASGTEQVLDVIVSTRGKSRLDICDRPPLRLEFDEDKTQGTLFEGQHKLKMVRQCLRSRPSRDWLYLELAVYRAYNVVTDFSFKVRALNATFTDTESRSKRGRAEPVFLIEDDDRMAERLNRHRIKPLTVQPEQMEPTQTAHNLLFQYLIGNTDFALKAGAIGDPCCHNGRVLTETGREQDWIIVPYDFDYAGILNTDYALPHEKLPIRQVSTRLYRGFCWLNDELEESIELFKQRREQIEAAFLPPELSKGKARRVKNYLERFYETINDPEELQQELFDKCRGPDSLPVGESPVSPDFEKKP